MLKTIKSSKMNNILKDNKLQSNEINGTNTQCNAKVVCIPNDIPLSNAEKSVLSKGLKFIPTNRRTDEFKTKQDTDKFFRRLRLRAHFSSQDSSDSDNSDQTSTQTDKEPIDTMLSKFDNKQTNWTPKPGKFHAVNFYIDKCRRDTNKIKFNNPPKRFNISLEERRALIHLRQREDIFIKPADKGGAVVVWHKQL